MTSANKAIPEAVWHAAMSYDQYYQLLEDLQREGKTTGEIQTAERIEKAPLNLARMKRLRQRATPFQEVLEELRGFKHPVCFLMIVEGWCGDAAQVVPVLQNVIDAMGWQSRYILRDEHPAVMDMFLTNGTRSIPVIVALDSDLKPLGPHWGPRPAVLQDLVNQWKVQMPKEDWHKELHSWYAIDKGEQMQKDFAEWLLSF